MKKYKWIVLERFLVGLSIFYTLGVIVWWLQSIFIKMHGHDFVQATLFAFILLGGNLAYDALKRVIFASAEQYQNLIKHSETFSHKLLFFYISVVLMILFVHLHYVFSAWWPSSPDIFLTLSFLFGLLSVYRASLIIKPGWRFIKTIFHPDR